MLNFNVAPYFDDFDPSKSYHKILFVPGRALQTRELTQIQSLIQHQIKLNADYMFKNGAMVIPGNVSFVNNMTYIKLEALHEGVLTDTLLESLVGKKIIGESTNVKAVVTHVEASTETEPAAIYVNYVSGGIVGGDYFKTFDKFEVLHLEDAPTTKIRVLNNSAYFAQDLWRPLEKVFFTSMDILFKTLNRQSFLISLVQHQLTESV